MRAVVWHGRRDVRLEEVPEPPRPGDGEAIVSISRCGLCGSDRREYDHGPVLIPRRPHPLTGRQPPIVLGHELSGRVVAVGDAGAADLVGARVAIDPTISCGRCRACTVGDRHLCASAACLGVSADGGLAPSVLVRQDRLVAVPEHLSDDEAAFAEPLAVALHAIHRAELRLGEVAVVIGFGPIGAGVALAARAAGASEVVVVEPDPARRELAATIGARALDPEALDGDRALRARCDVAVECSGAEGALDLAVRTTRPGGRIVVPAVPHGPVSLPLQRLVLGERSLLGSVGYRGDVARAVGLMAERVVDVRPLLAEPLPLDRVPHWFEDPAIAGPGLKVVVDVQG